MNLDLSVTAQLELTSSWSWSKRRSPMKGWSLVRDASTPALSLERFTRYSSCSVHSVQVLEVVISLILSDEEAVGCVQGVFSPVCVQVLLRNWLTSICHFYWLLDSWSKWCFHCLPAGQPEITRRVFFWRALWLKWSHSHKQTNKHDFRLIMWARAPEHWI